MTYLFWTYWMAPKYSPYTDMLIQKMALQKTDGEYKNTKILHKIMSEE